MRKAVVLYSHVLNAPKLQDNISPIWDEALDFDQILECFCIVRHLQGTSHFRSWYIASHPVLYDGFSFMFVLGRSS